MVEEGDSWWGQKKNEDSLGPKKMNWDKDNNVKGIVYKVEAHFLESPSQKKYTWELSHCDPFRNNNRSKIVGKGTEVRKWINKHFWCKRAAPALSVTLITTLHILQFAVETRISLTSSSPKISFCFVDYNLLPLVQRNTHSTTVLHLSWMVLSLYVIISLF